jgi:hypothetical protein
MGWLLTILPRVFHQAGFAVLLYYDHFSLGISDGDPRQQINNWVQTRGYLDAVNFVATTLPEIDGARIALWGDFLNRQARHSKISWSDTSNHVRDSVGPAPIEAGARFSTW